jgi:hypothetical protein
MSEESFKHKLPLHEFITGSRKEDYKSNMLNESWCYQDDRTGNLQSKNSYNQDCNKSDITGMRQLRVGSFQSLQGFGEQHSDSQNDSYIEGDYYIPNKFQNQNVVYLNNPREKIVLNTNTRPENQKYSGKIS